MTQPLDITWLQQHAPNRRIVYLPETTSTMHDAIALVEEGAPHGTCVVADRQTHGQGRLGRAWDSARHTGLYCTVLLRLPLENHQLPIVTLALGLAAVDAIQKQTSLVPDLRWPNDVLLGEGKCAGILVQQHRQALLAGIGVNVNQDRFPAHLQAIATSLRLETSREWPRETLLASLLDSIEARCQQLVQQGPKAIVEEFTRHSSYVRNRRVQVEQNESTLLGTTAGLTEQGFLRLRDDSGKMTTVLYGGVRPARGR